MLAWILNLGFAAGGTSELWTLQDDNDGNWTGQVNNLASWTLQPATSSIWTAQEDGID